ncbi:hypothetical protein PRZ48_015182 [Zasmidium cellare]|uniref:Major facilitator superfamily (MFS) profile domain-containing protein n=1 Tax=Zasmidium cellare TaxID=395010 RepID=A0ABR0DXV1_ZASCE|nr:hypothetical protein PRZ48_015182 [Zasmidium cellare]
MSTTLQSLRSSTPFITFTIAYAVFTDQFLFAAIVPVAPFALQQQLGIPEEKVQFWVTILLGVFGVACFVTSAPWGWYSDRSSSRRTPFLIGLFILLGATILLWVSPNIPVQILGRVLQGFASTIVWTTGLAVLVDTVGQAHIGEYMGYVGIALNAGTLVAPLLGGVVFERCGYNAVFGLIIAVVGIDILLRVVMNERTPSTGEVCLDKTASLSSLDLEAAPSTTKDDVPIISATSTVDTRPASSLPPIIRLCFSARFLATLWATLVLAATFSGFQTVLPLMVHDTFHWSSIGGGLIFLPLTFPALFGPLVGRLTDRFPNSGRWFATSGFLIMSVSLVLLRLVEKDLPDQQALLCVLLVLIGSCMTLALEPLLAEITGGATRLDAENAKSGAVAVGSYGQAYALFNMAWAGGNTVGPLWAGFIIEYAGWKTMTWTLGLLSGVTAIPVVLLCGGWIFGRRT